MARPAGIIASAPKRSSEARVCIDSTTPMAKPDVAISGAERQPISIDMPRDFREFVGRKEQFAQCPNAKQTDLANPCQGGENERCRVARARPVSCATATAP